MIGSMAMPANFKYRTVFLRGRPKHRKYDDFWRKHPPMPPERWAKIFSPFDALTGFDEAIAGTEGAGPARQSGHKSRSPIPEIL